MLERINICRVAAGLFSLALALAGCSTPEAPKVAIPEPAQPTPPPPPGPDPMALAEEARALLAQAETDVQRARARRALWQVAWESLVAARAAAGRDDAAAIRHARRASEFAQLGLEQLAYPAVK